MRLLISKNEVKVDTWVTSDLGQANKPFILMKTIVWH
jgi:hypothetical protein